MSECFVLLRILIWSERTGRSVLCVPKRTIDAVSGRSVLLATDATPKVCLGKNGSSIYECLQPDGCSFKGECGWCEFWSQLLSSTNLQLDQWIAFTFLNRWTLTFEAVFRKDLSSHTGEQQLEIRSVFGSPFGLLLAFPYVLPFPFITAQCSG